LVLLIVAASLRATTDGRKGSLVVAFIAVLLMVAICYRQLYKSAAPAELDVGSINNI
jgi:predicted RND superfamily exporter protein